MNTSFLISQQNAYIFSQETLHISLKVHSSILDVRIGFKDASVYLTHFLKYQFFTTVSVVLKWVGWDFLFIFSFKKRHPPSVFWNMYFLLHYYVSGSMNTYLDFGAPIGSKNKMFTNRKKSYYFRKLFIVLRDSKWLK